MKTFHWNLKALLTDHPYIRTASALHQRLSALGFDISYRQVNRLVQEDPTNLNLDLLAGIVTILECKLEELLVMRDQSVDDHSRYLEVAMKTWDGLSAQEKIALKEFIASIA